MPTSPRCPRAEELAAFLAGQLADDRRAPLVEHLADCSRCRRTLSEAVGVRDTLAPDDRAGAIATLVTTASSGRLTPPARGAALGIAAVAAVAVLAVPLVEFQRLWPLTGARAVSRLAAAVDGRVVEARVSGGLAYAPLEAPSPARRAVPAARRLLGEAAEVRHAFADDGDPAARHALGVAALLTGDRDEAVYHLSAAASGLPRHGPVLGDLAAALYERARRDDRPDDLPAALNMAERAIAAAPAALEPRFTRALILTALGLQSQAQDAWRAYLNLDATSGWGREAQAHLDRLTAPSPSASWLAVRDSVLQAPTSPVAEAAVQQHASRMREMVDLELFPAWASAVQAGASAESELERLRFIGAAFERVAGDRLYADTVAWMERTAARGPAALRDAARAVADYGVARRDFAAAKFGPVAPLLAAARVRFDALGSPLAVQAALDEGAAGYFTGRLDEAGARLVDAQGAAARRDYRDVEGRTYWLQGLIAFARGQYADAQALYESMLGIFERTRDVDQIASAHGLLANLHDVLGEAGPAWRHRLEALHRLPEVASPTTAQGILLSVAGNALATGQWHTAVAAQSETLAAWRPLRAPNEIQLLLQRARAQHALGIGDAPVRDLDTARALVAAMPESPLRARMTVDALAAEAEIFLRADPARAINAAERALAEHRARPDRIAEARLEVLLARAQAAAGHPDRAADAARSGVAALEAAVPSAPPMTLPANDAAWSAFDHAVQLAIERDQSDVAFQFSERSRLRLALEAQAWQAPPPRPADLTGVLDDGTALLVLHQLENRVVGWLVDTRGVRSFTGGLTRARAQALVAEHVEELRRGPAAPHASDALFEALIRPVLPALRGVRRLVVVPGQPYLHASFAALRNRSTGRFLVEDMSLVAAPSVRAYLTALDAADTRRGRARSALLVDPGPTSDPALVSAYDHVDALTHEAATPAAMMRVAAHPVIHLAALTAPNSGYPLLSRLLLTDEGGRRYSGTLFIREVPQNTLASTRLLVLGPTTTGPHAGGDGTLGVARSFLTSGVPTVAGELAPVDRSATASLWRAFHRAYASGRQAADSLRDAQLAALTAAGGRPGPWGALAVFGSGH
ncbi:MAG: CHAT domain-containing protein [Acidobacteriota bacterium]